MKLPYWREILLIILWRFDCAFTLDRQGPVFIHEPPSRVDFANTTGSIILCSAHGNPAPIITWVTQGGSPVSDVPRLRHVRPDGSLVFLPFRAEEYRQDVHESAYRCLASNSVGITGSREIHVKGVVQQFYVVDVYDEFVIRGNTAVLRCSIPGLVKDYVTVTSWIQDGSFVIRPTALAGDRFSIFPTGELHVRKVEHGDGQKRFQCETRHRLTGESVISATSGKLLLTETFRNISPRISDSKRYITAFQGETLEVPCAAQGFPVPTYRWYRKEGGRLAALHVGNRLLQLDGTLIIQEALVQDSGHYVCMVNNSDGSDNAETEILVTAPLSAQVYPKLQSIDVGKSATFNCSTAGHPIVAIEWVKDMVPVRPNARVQLPSRDILRLTAVQREDRGVYQCFAFNDFESAQGTAQLILGDYPPSLLETFPNQTLQSNPTVTLKCVASGNPLPQITWTLDGATIPEKPRFRMGDYVRSDATVVSYVNITSIQPEDGGLYKCTAGNDVGITSHSERINVFGAPFIRPMANASVVAGEAMKLQCPVGGYPIETIKWEREGVRLPYNHRQKVFPNGSLVVQDVERATDEGRYTCSAKNKGGTTAENSLYVSVLVRPFVETFSFPKSLQQGQPFSVLCTVTKGDPPIQLTWLKDGKKIQEGQGVHSLDVTSFSSTLVFESVSPEHRGNYTCVAANGAGAVSHTATMVIHVPPRWRVEPSDTSVTKGRSAYIDCQAEGFPIPRIRWTRAEGDIASEFKPISSSSRLHVFENGSLVIHNVQEDDSGYYLCQATNGIGQAQSKVVKLSVHVAAHFNNKFRAETVRKGHDAKLKCEAVGDRPIAITWLKDKQAFEPQMDPRYELTETVLSGGMTSEITIRRADRRDSALFTCLTSNAFGQDDTNVQLIMQEPPDTPQDVKVLNYDSRSAKLGWSPPYSGNSLITDYIVHYKEEGDRWHHKMANVTVPGSEATVTITGLQPVTYYHFRIFAVNALGRSEPSHVVHVKMDEEAPGGPPLKVKATPTGAHAVKVTWKPPRKELQFGAIKGYYVGYKIAGSVDTYVYKTLDVKGDSFVEESQLINLRRFTKYSVIVQAFNSKGAGPPSDEIIVQTLQNDPPKSPLLKAIFSNNSAIGLSWEESPEDNNPVNGYILNHKWELGEWQEAKLLPTNKQYILTQLRCGSRYQFYVTAFNAIGKGEPSDIIRSKTDGIAPVAPDKQSLLTTNKTFAIVHLDSWHDGGCPLTSFSVRYREQRQQTWILVSDSVPTARSQFVLGELTPGTWYQLQVTAHNEAGSTDAEYTFVTVPAVTETMTTSPVNDNIDLPFYLDINILVPAAVSLAVVIALIVLVCVIVQKRYSSDSTRSESSTYGGRKCHVHEPVQMSELEKSSLKKALSVSTHGDYYPTPYATTRLASDEQKSIDSSCRQALDEPLYATVKRTPRPPRSDFHIYHYPGEIPEIFLQANASPDGAHEGRASTSQWRESSGKIEEVPAEKLLCDSNRSVGQRKTYRYSHR